MNVLRFFALVIARLKIENLSGFVTETVEVARPIINMMEASMLKVRFNMLDEIATRLRGLLNQSRTSPITEELRVIDESIKEKLDVIKYTVSAFALLPPSAKTTAAKRLLPIFKEFWDVTSKSYANQEAQLKELRQRIASMGDNLEALTTLELMPTWLEFTALDDTFNTLYTKRVYEDASAAPAPTSIKDEVVSDYELFSNLLVLQIATDPTEQLMLLFNEMNIVRKKYALPRRHRLSRKRTSAEIIPPQPYFGGKAITPLTRIFYTLPDETVELVFTVDYTVSYRNNKEVGDAMMIVHGRGKYVGQFMITFHITR